MKWKFKMATDSLKNLMLRQAFPQMHCFKGHVMLLMDTFIDRKTYKNEPTFLIKIKYQVII